MAALIQTLAVACVLLAAFLAVMLFMGYGPNGARSGSQSDASGALTRERRKPSRTSAADRPFDEECLEKSEMSFGEILVAFCERTPEPPTAASLRTREPEVARA